MTEKSKGFIILEWVCPSCGTRNPGPQQTCSKCGSPQPENELGSGWKLRISMLDTIIEAIPSP